MPPPEELLQETTQSNPIPLQRFSILPRLHPNGWKLEIRDDTDQVMFQVFRHLTTPLRYKIQHAQSNETHSMHIKSCSIGKVQRISLFKGSKEWLSVCPLASSPMFFLRDHHRRVIARFNPINPEITLLRTTNSTVARIRFKPKQSPLGFVAEFKLKNKFHWLYAITLYIIAHIEEQETAALLAKEDAIPKANESEPANP